MNLLIVPHPYHCPYCGELIDTLVDTSQGNQHTIEDCRVCCRPIELEININEADQCITVFAKSDSE